VSGASVPSDPGASGESPYPATQIAGPLVVALMVFLALAAGILLFAADAQNRMARSDSLHTGRSAFHALERGLSEMVRHYAAWTADRPRYDADWARQRLTGPLFRDFDVDAAQLYGADDRPNFSAAAAGRSEPAPTARAGPVVAALLRQARTAPRDRALAITGYLKRNDAVQLLAAAPLPAAVPAAQRPVLVLRRTIDADALARLGRDYLLSDLRLAQAVPDGFVGLQLYAPEGRRVAQAVWRPDQPGASMLQHLAAPVAAGLVVLLLLVVLIAQRARSTTQALDAANAHLARRNAQLVESERAARDARAEAEMASRSKSEFLATMSHELRTPLNAIIGFGEILERELLGPIGTPAYRDYARDIHDSGTHLLDLINDILDLSKAEAGKLELQEQEVDLAEILERCAAMLRPKADAAGQTLTVELPPALPGFHGDPRKLKQIVINLAGNAIKFTPEGGRVHLAARLPADGGIELSVEDDGIGIAPRDMARVQQPFGQVDSALSRKHAGTGLGLSIVRAMTAAHGGRFVLESRLGAGTRAAVQLPAERLRAAPAVAAPARARLKAAAG
jgi:signal transduction histidine kinase